MQKPRKEQKAMTGLFLVPDAACKICLESTSVEDLIHPCRCTGSIHYVHEECLKRWILSNVEELDKARCELCNYSYLMDYKIASVCNFSKETCTCNARIILIVKLFIIQLMIWLLIGNIYLKLRDNSHVVVLVIFLIISVFATISAFGFTVILIFRQWVGKVLKDWVISNYEGPATEASTYSPHTINTRIIVPNTVIARGLKVLVPKKLDKEIHIRIHTEHDGDFSDRRQLIHNRARSQDFGSLYELSYQ